MSAPTDGATIAYGDPCYLGRHTLYPERTPVDHEQLVRRLALADGWALSASSTSLAELLAIVVDVVGPNIPRKTLARAVLAWQRLGDRGFGDPVKWDCYEYRGWKLDMSGNEAFFDTEFEAQAIKSACVNAHGLAETVLGAGS